MVRQLALHLKHEHERERRLLPAGRAKVGLASLHATSTSVSSKFRYVTLYLWQLGVSLSTL